MIPEFFSRPFLIFSVSAKAPAAPASATQNIISRVNTLISTCKSAIPESDQNKVNDLLDRMKQLSAPITGVPTETLVYLKNSCIYLEVFITQVLKTIQSMPILKFQLAAEAVLKEPDNAQAIIKEFNITDEQERVALIRIALKKGSHFILQISEIIPSFNISNEQDRIKIAQFVAGHWPGMKHLCAHIKKFNIPNENERFTIATFVAKKMGPRIFECLNDFDLTDEHRLEILAQAVDNLIVDDIDHTYYQLAEGMRRLHRHERIFLLKIFSKTEHKKLIDIEDRSLLPFIAEADLKDRIELAKAVAAKQPSYLSCIDYTIKNFNIPDEDDRFEIAKIFAFHHREYNVSGKILGFEVTDQQKLIALAEICAKHQKTNFSIKDFGIKDEQTRIAIAKIEAKSKGKINNVHDYDINNPQDLLAIAKLAASVTGTTLPWQIADFGITDKQELMAIARMAALNKGGGGLLNDLFRFSFGDPKNRDEIITLVARNGFEYDIQGDQLKVLSRDETLKFLKVYAANGHSIVSLITDYGNSPSQITLQELAEIVAEINGLDFAFNVYQCKIQSIETLARLLLLALKSSPADSKEIIFEILHHFSTFTHRYKVNKPDYDVFINAPAGRVLSDFIAKELSADPVGEHKCLEWLCMLAELSFLLNKSDVEMTERLPFFKAILSDEDPDFRYALMTVPLSEKIIPHKESHLQLFHMLLTPLFEKTGMNNPEQEKIWSVLKHKDYRDVVKREKAIRGLYNLWACQSLTAYEKERLLKHIFQTEPSAQSQQKLKDENPPVYQSLQMLEAVLSSGNSALLKKSDPQLKAEIDEKNSKEDVASKSFLKEPINIQESVKQCFTKIVRLDAIHDFGRKYAATIGSDKTRNKIALLIYGAKLGSLSGEARHNALSTLKEFATAVLEEKYAEWRYQSKGIDSHFELVTKDHPQLKVEWQKGERLTVGELLAEQKLKKEADTKALSPASHTFDVFKHLKERANHIPDDLVHLKKFFVDRKGALAQANKVLTANILPQSAKYDPKNEVTAKVFKAKLEISIMKLMDPTIPSKNKVEDINRMLPHLISICGDKQFAQDIRELKGYLEGESKSQAQTDIGKKYVVEDTDKWEDMLLCGTEVTSSCQRISGDVHLNKCLLGYLADPKNRVIVLKDAKTGQIVARRIMRLLWDDKAKKPVLFQERLYHNPGVPPEALQAIDRMFERRAKHLQLSLVQAAENNSTHKPYPNKLDSFGSPSPFEYVDAAKIGITNGKYTIPAVSIAVVQA